MTEATVLGVKAVSVLIPLDHSYRLQDIATTVPDTPG